MMTAIFPAMSRSIKCFFAHPSPNSPELMRLAALLRRAGLGGIKARSHAHTAGTKERRAVVPSCACLPE